LVTLDWKRELFYLKPIKKIIDNSLQSYEYNFAPNFKTNKMSFYNKWVDHSLSNPFELDSKILSINGIKVMNLTNEQLCSIWENEKDKLKTPKVKIEILEIGKKRTITLTKKQLIPY